MYSSLPPQYHFQTITPSSSSPSNDDPSSWSSSSSSNSPQLCRPSFNEKPTHYAPYGFSGDGWSQLLLPIPPEVEDPYEFLRRIQEEWDRQSAKVAAKRRRNDRGGRGLNSSYPYQLGAHSIRDEDTRKWECFLKLPNEVWNAIAQDVCESGFGYGLALASKAFNQLVSPMMYSTPVLQSLSSLSSFLETMTAHSNGTALSCINPMSISSLSLQLASIDWTKAEQLGEVLRSTGARIKTLKVECAGSDLERARDVFARFDPEVFEWHTAPCWLIRPAKVFEEILLGWPNLHTLKLSGFFWDANFISTLVNLGALRKLHLSGRTMSSLSWESFSLLLDPPASTIQNQDDLGASHEGKLYLNEIHLSDLPPGKASTFDDENESLRRASAAAFSSSCYFSTPSSNGGNTRAGSISPTAMYSHGTVTSPVQMMTRSSSVDTGIEMVGETQQSRAWLWQCDNRDYGNSEGKGSMSWWR